MMSEKVTASTVDQQSGRNQLKKMLVDAVASSINKVLPAELENNAVRQSHYRRKDIRAVIRELVSEGELAYTGNLGCTFIEKSFNRPVRISEAVVLKPPAVSYDAGPGDVVIELLHGESFGTGRHPTTRLSILGIEHAMQRISCVNTTGGSSVALDIGTGSGVLALVAAGFGIQKAVGTDIDACARNEARKNVKINGLSHRIEIKSEFDISPRKRFSLITANLRCPTLKSLCPQITRIMAPGSALVISGIKPQEIEEIIAAYTQNALDCVWQRSEKGWSGLVFTKNA